MHHLLRIKTIYDAGGMLLILLALHPLLQPFSWGQTHKPAKALYANCPSYLECAQQIANDELNRISNEATRLKNQGKGFVPCDEDRLLFEQDYINWFFKNKDEFQKIYEAATTAVELQDQKLSSINEQSVDVNPTANQTNQTAVPVTLKKIQNYLIQLNDRLSTCPENQVDILMKGVEDPRWNSTNIAHSQVQTAIDKINTIVMASLQQENITSKLVLTQDLSARKSGAAMTLTLDTSYKQTPLLSLNLLKYNFATPSEGQKWASIIKAGIKIDGYSLDGAIRYAEMQAKRTSACASTETLLFPRQSSVPFVSYVDHVSILKPNNTQVSLTAAHSVLLEDATTGDVLDVGENLKEVPEIYVSSEKELFLAGIDRQNNNLMVKKIPGTAWQNLGGGCIKVTKVEFYSNGDILVHVIGTDNKPWQRSLNTDWVQK